MKHSIALLVTVVAVSLGPSSLAEATQPERLSPASISVTPISGNGSAAPYAVCRVFPRVCRW